MMPRSVNKIGLQSFAERPTHGIQLKVKWCKIRTNGRTHLTNTAAKPTPSSEGQYHPVVLAASSAFLPSLAGSMAPSRHASRQPPPPTSSFVSSSLAALGSARSALPPSSAFALLAPSLVASLARAGIGDFPLSSRQYTAYYLPASPFPQ